MEEGELGWTSEEDVDEDLGFVWPENRLSVTRQQREKKGYITIIRWLISIELELTCNLSDLRLLLNSSELLQFKCFIFIFSDLKSRKDQTNQRDQIN